MIVEIVLMDKDESSLIKIDIEGCPPPGTLLTIRRQDDKEFTRECYQIHHYHLAISTGTEHTLYEQHVVTLLMYVIPIKSS